MNLTIRSVLTLVIVCASCTTSAQAFSDSYVRAFLWASHNQVDERKKQVLHEMNQWTPFEELVQRGIVASPYDCLPEHRIWCFDILKRPTIGSPGDTIVQEWGEWWDGTDETGKRDMVFELFASAATRGFNLLSNAELAASAAFELRRKAAGLPIENSDQKAGKQ